MSEIEKIKEKIKPVAKKYKLTYIWVFGSYAKKKQNKNSDIDILVKTDGKVNTSMLKSVKVHES